MFELFEKLRGVSFGDSQFFRKVTGARDTLSTKRLARSSFETSTGLTHHCDAPLFA